MLEMCTTLQECELMLTGELEKSAFLGQVELPSEDVEKLGILIRDLVGHGIQQGTQYLRDYAPTCLSLFLVGLGIWKYREGNYWSAVAVAVGLEDVSWQIRWGQFFLEFLQRRDLPQFDLEQKGEGSRRYVTPILLHGGIPQHCLSDFFSCIITGLIDHDCLAEDDIKDWLYSIREQEFQKKDLYKEIEGLRKEKEKLSEDHGRLVRLENLQKKAKQLAAAASSPEQWNDLPEDCAGFLQAKESELEEDLP